MAYGIMNGTGDKAWGKDDTPKGKTTGTLKTGTEKLKGASKGGKKKTKAPPVGKIKGLG